MCIIYLIARMHQYLTHTQKSTHWITLTHTHKHTLEKITPFRIHSPTWKVPTYQYQFHYHDDNNTDPIAADFQSCIAIRIQTTRSPHQTIPCQTNHPISSQSRSYVMLRYLKHMQTLSRTEHSQNHCFSATL